MSFESKEDESESAAHLRQLAEDMPEVRVVHATPAARAIRSSVLRVLLNPLQAVPGYTFTPRLEDGAGIVAFETIGDDNYLSINAFQAGVRYHLARGGDREYMLLAFNGREVQELIAPGSTSAADPLPAIRLTCALRSPANGRQWMCQCSYVQGRKCTHDSRPDSDRASGALRGVWLRPVKGEVDSGRIAIADVANQETWEDYLDEVLRVDPRAVRDLIDLPICSGVSLYDMIAPGLHDRLDEHIFGTTATVREYLADALRPVASDFFAGLLDAAAVSADDLGMAAHAQAYRCTVAARTSAGVPGSAERATVRSPLFAAIADLVRTGAWDATDVHFCALWLQNALDLAASGALAVPLAAEAADGAPAEADDGSGPGQAWRRAAVAFLPAIDGPDHTDLGEYPDIVLNHFQDVLGWDVSTGSYIPNSCALRPPPVDFDALVAVLRVWVLQSGAVLDALKPVPDSPAHRAVFQASVKKSACARRRRVTAVAANVPVPTSAQLRADAAAAGASARSPVFLHGGGGGGGGVGDWHSGRGGGRLPFASMSPSVESGEDPADSTFPTPLMPPESGREHAGLVAATAASIAAKAKADADAAEASAAHCHAKFQAEVRALAAAEARAAEAHEVAMRCLVNESDNKIRAHSAGQAVGAGLAAPPAPAPAPAPFAPPRQHEPPPGMAPPPPPPPGDLPPTTCLCQDGVTRYRNTVTGNWLPFDAVAAPSPYSQLGLGGGAAAGGGALPAALCAVSSATLPAKFSTTGYLFDRACDTLPETSEAFGRDLLLFPCYILFAAVDCTSAHETAPSLLSTAQTDKLVETDVAGGAQAEGIRVGFQRAALDKNMLKQSTCAAILKTSDSASAFLSSFQALLTAEKRTVQPLSLPAQVIDAYSAVFMSLSLHRAEQGLLGWGYEAYFQPLLKKLFSDILELRSACSASKGGANAMFFRATLLKWLRHRADTGWCDDDSRAIIQTCMQAKFDKANDAHAAAIADLTAKCAAAAKAAVAKQPPAKAYPKPVCRGCSVKAGVVKCTSCYLGSCPNAALAGEFSLGKA